MEPKTKRVSKLTELEQKYEQAMIAMLKYMTSHNYDISDRAKYTKDGEYQKLNSNLIEAVKNLDEATRFGAV